MTQDFSKIKEALNKLSSKQHVLSEEALRAKQQLETDHPYQITPPDPIELKKHEELLSQFNTSIHLLMAVFKQSKFDEVFGILSEPSRLMVLNFLIGIVRGLGFTVGILVVLTLVFSIIGWPF